ncbi:MAG TPA: M23 family metallopeptidase, partial [Limnobacter sp.]|nr:M23 family metallopeptidase [Limnobacter sp.]
SEVYSPISGKVVRITLPYKSDNRYKGLVIDGSGQFQGYSVKLFYLDPIKEIAGKAVKKGELIGFAQDLTVKYKGIGNHIHFEVTVNGVSIDPSRFLEKEQSCKA